MPTFLDELNRRRTFAIISHPDAGKTTLTEKLLLFGGAIQMAGTIKGRKAARHATSDWMALEQQRGISVTSSVMQFPYRDRIVNLLDTPGHEDFSEDTYRTLTAVDSALMVIDCARGVEERTIKLMEVCRLRDTPIFTFINKLDRDGREPIELLDEVENILKIRCAPITWPIGMGRELKGVYHLDQDFIHFYDPSRDGRINTGRTLQGLDNPAVDAALGAERARALRDEIELVRGASHAFDFDEYRAGRLTPVFFGSALTNFGVQEMLDGFIEQAPPPRPCAAASRDVSPEEEAFTGFVFKIQANMDPQHRDRIAFLRVCSGAYQPGMKLRHVRLGREVKIADALTFMAAEREHAEAAYPGDIIGLHNHGTIRIGDTFTQGEDLTFTGIPDFAPELFRRARLRDPLKMKALQKGLEQLCEEGATQLFRPLNSNDLILGAVGILQFDVAAFRLRGEYGVECGFENVNVITARWVNCANAKRFEEFKTKLHDNLALDHHGELVYIAPSRVNLQLTQERWPEVRFAATREHGGIERMRHVLQRMARWLCRRLFRVELRGWEHYPHHEPRLLIVANHVSYLDGMLLAAFLPDLPVFVIDTHVARHWWVKPFIAITRHISVDPTNPHYLKTLIQHIRAGERVAVFPEGRLSLTGALMKIYEGPALAADKADAALLPVYIDGAQYSLLSRLGGIVRRRLLPRVRLTMLPPRRLSAPPGSSRARRQQLGRQLDELLVELAYVGMKIDQPLFLALLEARERHGDGRIVLEDAQQRLDFRALLTRAFILAELLEPDCAGQRNVGLLLPNAATTVIALLALHLRGWVPVLLNFTAGSHDLRAACRVAQVRTVCTSRAFVAAANLDGHIAALDEQARVLFLEDVQARATLPARLRGLLRARLPARSFRHLAGTVQADDPAVILFTSGSEREPRGVALSHRNLLANIAQIRAVLDITPRDVVLNTLPPFHAFGLTAATLTPLLLGTRLILYPSPLHYHVIPELAYERHVTVLFGTNTFLMGYGRHADPYDFFNVRLVVMGAEALREETRRLWVEKFGIRISEGYGLTETSPVLAVNSRRHHRGGTVGKLLPGVEHEVEAVEGIADGGLLCVRGANVMLGYLAPEQPGRLLPPRTERGLGWYDTGDIARIDADGFVTLLGRVKRFAKLGGEMISLATVEQLAAGCWPEHQHAALNRPDPVKGEHIVLLTTRQDADHQELIEAARRMGLGELYIPRQVLAVPEIPLLGSGKPDYPGIRRLAEDLMA